MKVLFAILALCVLGISNARADQPINSYALAPSFHYITAVKANGGASCESDADKSIDFTDLFSRSHSALGNLRLNIYDAPNDQRLVELIGVTLDKSTTVQVRFVTSADTVAYFEQYWVLAPKRKWLAVTVSASLNRIFQKAPTSRFA